MQLKKEDLQQINQRFNQREAVSCSQLCTKTSHAIFMPSSPHHVACGGTRHPIWLLYSAAGPRACRVQEFRIYSQQKKGVKGVRFEREGIFDEQKRYCVTFWLRTGCVPPGFANKKGCTLESYIFSRPRKHRQSHA